MLNSLKTKLFNSIKIISTVLIIAAIGLESWNIYTLLNNVEIPNSYHAIFWCERFVVTAHFFEGIIAAYFAPSKNKIPIQYGIYTFFVGTIGLLELFEKEEEFSHPPHIANQ